MEVSGYVNYEELSSFLVKQQAVRSSVRMEVSRSVKMMCNHKIMKNYLHYW